MASSSLPPINNLYNILLVGKVSTDKTVYTYASSFVSALRALGHQVSIFNNKENRLPFPAKTHEELPYLLKNLNSIVTNRALLSAAQHIKPDIIFVIKGENIAAKTIKNLRAPGRRLINFYPDNPFTFWNGNSNHNVLLALPHYTTFLIWSKQLIPILRAAGCNDVRYFPFAYDEALFPQEVFISQTDHERYDCDVIFIGTWDTHRERWLERLRRNAPNIKLSIWGNRWQQQLKQTSLLRSCWHGDAIYGNEMIKAFRCSRIVLNFMRAQNLDAHNMRTFEVPASRAFLLTQHTSEQAELLFSDGINIATFSTDEDLLKKIAFYLNTDTIRNKIAHEAWLTATQFTLIEQLRKFFTQLDKKVEPW